MRIKNIIPIFAMIVAGIFCSCHEEYYITNGNGSGGSGWDSTNVTLTLSPITFNDSTFQNGEASTRTLSYDIPENGPIKVYWDTLNSVGVFPIAPDTNSQVKYSFHSKKVDVSTITYRGQGWNLKPDNTYASYYPFQDFINTKSSKDIPMFFHDQKQIKNTNADHLDSINNIYYAVAHRPEGENSITFNYNRAAGIMWIKVTAPDGMCGKGRLTIASCDGKKIFTDSATVDVSTGKITRIKTSDRVVLHYDSVRTNNAEYNSLMVGTINAGDVVNLFLSMAPIAKTEKESMVGDLVFEICTDKQTFYSYWRNTAIPTANSAYCYTISPSSARRTHVDLGLPSGTQWGDCNLGALVSTDHGYYFAWGESWPKGYYFWDDYLLNISDDAISSTASLLKKYTIPDRQYYGAWYDENRNFIGDGLTELEADYDAAVKLLGSNSEGYWDMPTREQYQELIDNCTLTWTENYRESDVNGYLCTSKNNGNSIFFPAAGYMGKENERDSVDEQMWYTDQDGIQCQKNARGLNYDGYYWTKTLSDGYSTDAYEFKFNTYMVEHSSEGTYRATPVPNLATSKRYIGESIRPVFHLKK